DRNMIHEPSARAWAFQKPSTILYRLRPFVSERPSAPVKSVWLNPICATELRYAPMLEMQMSTGVWRLSKDQVHPNAPSLLRRTSFGQFTYISPGWEPLRRSAT